MSNHLLGLDLETTGLDKNSTSVTQIALVHYNGEQRLSDFNMYVRPQEHLNFELGALKVTNKTFADYSKHQDREEAAKLLVHYLVRQVFPSAGNKEIKIVGHNVAFDVVRLRDFLASYNITGWDSVFSYRLIDTATIGQFLRDTGVIKLDKMSLGNLAKALGIEVEDNKLHDALVDVDLTFKCYFEMLKIIV